MAQLRIDTTTGAPVITADSGAVNITALAASTWQTAAGALTINGAAGITLVGGVNVSGTQPLTVAATGSHRFSAGTLQVDTACDFGTAANVTASGNPTFDFGTATSRFAGGLFVAGNVNVGGFLNYQTTVTAVTAPLPVGASDSGECFTNEGAIGLPSARIPSLPAAEARLRFIFINENGNNIRIQAAAGDNIRIGTSISAIGGYIESTGVGDAVELIAVNTTTWLGFGVVGTWLVV